jgi:hypothetical protein
VLPPWRVDEARPFPKPHHPAHRILERLRDEYPHFRGSYSLVPRYVNSLRMPAPTPGPLARVGHPGECPGDVGTAEAVLDGVPQTCQDLTVRVPFSTAGDLQLLGGETADGLRTGLQGVFERRGGVPSRLIVDNASAVGRKVAGEVRLTALVQRLQAP